jgi:hypothetical protein
MPPDDDLETPSEPELPADETEEEVPEPPPHGRIPPEEPPADEAPPMTLGDLSVYDTLRFAISLLGQQAWMRLGLTVLPGQTEPVADLPQARVAIDALEALVRLLEPSSDEAEKRELHTLLDNLRVNYVRKAT